MTTGSEVIVPLGVTRADQIRRLFMPERTQFLQKGEVFRASTAGGGLSMAFKRSGTSWMT